MRKVLSVFLTLVLLLTPCAGCAAPAPETEGLQVVCTVFPLYDWAREIAGEDARVSLLLRSGVDLHSYQPTAEDIVRVVGCDLFIYVGGPTDAWVADVLRNAGADGPRVICLMDLLGGDVKMEELTEGMEAEAEEEEEEADEHVWLSLRNAGRFTAAIAEAMEELDGSHATGYAARQADYAQKLAALDADFAAAAAAGPKDTLIFCDRFPFRYLLDDYGLRYYAAFPGCSSETAASFETVAFLAGKADELGVKVLLTIEGSDGSLARTVAANTGRGDLSILAMDSLQSVTDEAERSGLSYLSAMENNLAVLRSALQ